MNVSNLVFTGSAVDAAGKPIVRADLETACAAAGLTVRKAFPAGTTYALVSSREDTVKAKAAKSAGMPIVSYATLLAVLHANGTAVVQKAAPDPYVDLIPEEPEPAKPEIDKDCKEYGGDL